MPKRLLIIGAGPKAVAIAAKARALSECGYSVPEIEIVEKNVVGANWAGGFGYTDGLQLLETPPEKDIGFPYSSKEFEASVDVRTFTNYSWHSYLIKQNEGSIRYSERIDRGAHMRPTLADWAGYLQWVAQKSNARITKGDVVELRPFNDRWTVTYVTGGVKRSSEGDALVITGPGPARVIEGQPRNHPRILDGSTLWNELPNMAKMTYDDEPIGIVGSGGAAASTILALTRTLRQAVPILVINRGGAIFSRGESYWENRVFSDPDDCTWTSMPLEDRIEFIKRTSNGVFSVAAAEFIGRLPNVLYLPMEVKNIEVVTENEPDSPQGLPVMIGHSGLRLPLRYAIIAIGFDAWWFWPLISDPGIKAHFQFEENRRIIGNHIGRDLSFDRQRVPTAPLHVPMLAAAPQGPGFPTLNCLGHLSDRILRPYVRKS